MRWTTLPEFENTPLDWHLSLLQKEADFVFGQSPDSEHYNEQGEGLPFLQGNADFTETFPRTAFYTRQAGKKCEPKDTLISVRAPVGELCRADQQYALGRGVAALRPLSMDSDFFFYAMNRWRKPLQQAAQGSTFDAVTGRHFSQLQCLVPPEGEQTCIAETLKVADDLIFALEKQIRKTERVKKALLQSFPPSPKHGSGIPLHQVADITSGFTKGRDLSGHETMQVAYLTVVNVLDGRVDISDLSTTEVKLHEVEHFGLRDGDILMTEGGDRDKVGRGSIWLGQVPQVVCQNHIFRVRLNAEKVLPWFMHYLLQTFTAKRYFATRAKQSSNLCSINSREMRLFELPKLTTKEQYPWVERLRSADTMIVALEAQLTAARRVKQSLLQNLLTGKIRLKA